MPWKKDLKKMSEISESNRALDMESMERFQSLLEDIKDTENVVNMEFLKEFLRLRPETDAAMQELKIKIAEIGNIDYHSIIDETDQKIYLGFKTRES